MNRSPLIIRTVLWLIVLIALAGCTLPGQTASSPTPEPVDVNAVMTSAAATAFVELTTIAQQASATPAPTAAPIATQTLAPVTETPVDSTGAATATTDPALVSTATLQAGGLPATETPAVMEGTPVVVPSLTPLGPAAPTYAGPVCYNSKFVDDITVPDGTVLKPYEKFYKVWRIQNTGSCTWDQGFGLVLWAGPDMGGQSTYYSNGDQVVKSGGIVDLGVEMRAPVQPGEYIAHWVMINDSGKTFGGDLTVYIKVVK